MCITNRKPHGWSFIQITLCMFSVSGHLAEGVVTLGNTLIFRTVNFSTTLFKSRACRRCKVWTFLLCREFTGRAITINSCFIASFVVWNCRCSVICIVYNLWDGTQLYCVASNKGSPIVCIFDGGSQSNSITGLVGSRCYDLSIDRDWCTFKGVDLDDFCNYFVSFNFFILRNFAVESTWLVSWFCNKF